MAASATAGGASGGAGNSVLTPTEQSVAEEARGFMPTDEGLALAAAAAQVDPSLGPMLEVGGYCGKSACYLGPVARRAGTVVFSVDHHRGSEENQAGWEWHDPDLVDPETGLMDTLPCFRRTIGGAGLESVVVAVVGPSVTVARCWQTPLSLLFIDGGHGVEPAADDYRWWTPKVASGGLLVIHDVFTDPADGGQVPYEQIYRPAVASELFEPHSAVGSLRVLRRR